MQKDFFPHLVFGYVILMILLLVKVLKKTNVASFHKFINNIENSIKFTVEHEVENAIPYLDVLIICNSGQLTAKVYCYETKTCSIA